MMAKIHYISSRIGGVGKYKAFRDSCFRQIKAHPHGKVHIVDLLNNATSKRGNSMRDTPMRKGMVNVMRQDKRFLYEGDGVYSIAQDL